MKFGSIRNYIVNKHSHEFWSFNPWNTLRNTGLRKINQKIKLRQKSEHLGGSVG